MIAAALPWPVQRPAAAGVAPMPLYIQCVTTMCAQSHSRPALPAVLGSSAWQTHHPPAMKVNSTCDSVELQEVRSQILQDTVAAKSSTELAVLDSSRAVPPIRFNAGDERLHWLCSMLCDHYEQATCNKCTNAQGHNPASTGVSLSSVERSNLKQPMFSHCSLRVATTCAEVIGLCRWE